MEPEGAPAGEVGLFSETVWKWSFIVLVEAFLEVERFLVAEGLEAEDLVFFILDKSRETSNDFSISVPDINMNNHH